MWFPVPEDPSGLKVLGSEGPAAGVELLELLRRTDCEDWQDRVGSAGASNASAKSSVRLRCCQGWVFKTDLAVRSDSPASLRAMLGKSMALAQSSSLWHPSKQWFLMRIGDVWHPLTKCRKLITLREMDPLRNRITAWSRMIEKAVSYSVRYGIGLDINPSNFGIDPESEENVYYIDDELYPPLKGFDVAQVVAARIPEEPSASNDDWRSWGSSLQQTLEGFLSTRDEWREFVVHVSDYPLTDRFQDGRNALLDGLRKGHPLLDPAERKKNRFQHKLTAIIADVHGNVQALDATLKEARGKGADSFLFLGDAVGYGPNPRQCIERLAELPNAILLRGNHDHAVGSGSFENGMNRIAVQCARWTYDSLRPNEREWLSSLSLEFQAPDWLAVHGAPRDPHRIYAYIYELTYRENLDYLHEKQMGVCFYGHTHVQFVHVRTGSGEKLKRGAVPVKILDGEGVMLINPGSVGQPRDGFPTAAYALWDRATNQVAFHRAAYPIEQVTSSIRKEGLPADLIYRLETGR